MVIMMIKDNILITHYAAVSADAVVAVVVVVVVVVVVASLLKYEGNNKFVAKSNDQTQPFYACFIYFKFEGLYRARANVYRNEALLIRPIHVSKLS